MRRTGSLALLMAGWLTAGCAAQTPPDVPTARLLIRFSAQVHDPAAPTLLQTLRAAAGTEVRYVRTIGATTHLFALYPVRDEAELARIVRRLEALPVVVYAEEDRRLRPLNGSQPPNTGTSR